MALNNLPLTGQSLGVTRVPINQNFAVIDAAFSVDHVDFNLTNQGKHNQVTMPVQAASPATLASEVALFSRTSPLTGVPEMAWRRQSNGSVIEFTGALLASSGWSYMPSGLLIKWGHTSATGLTTVTFPTGANIPAFTTIYSMNITTAYVNTSDGDGFVRLNNFLAPYTQFSVYASRRTSTGSFGPVSFQYFAIGV